MPSDPRLHGAAIGEAHAQQLRRLLASEAESEHPIILDFAGVEGVTASYLKRLLHPFFAPPNDPDLLPTEMAPIFTNVQSADLKEELDDFLAGKGLAIVLADLKSKKPKFRELIGRLDRAAAETFRELQTLKKSTAAELYNRHREETSNQTAWNNRLVQLVEMRIARRTRVGRFWVYEPIVQS